MRVRVHRFARSGEHIGISPLIKNKVKPKGSAVSDHLLLCNHSPYFENFTVLIKENIKNVCLLFFLHSAQDYSYVI